MTLSVLAFNCPRCERGEFRCLPGADGKGFCPWCGDAVSGGVAPPPSTPAAAAPEPDLSLASAGLEQLLDHVGRAVPEHVVRALRDRVDDLSRARDRAQSDLRQELEKKDRIKKVVMEEVDKLGSEVGDTKIRLRRKEEDHLSAVAELSRLKGDLETERRKVADLSKARGGLEVVEEITRNLEAKLEGRRRSVRDLEEKGDAARREAEQLRSDFEKTRDRFETELAELSKKVAAAEARLGTLKAAETELNELRVRARRLDKERAESQDRAAKLQAELEKRDQRIRELQALIKTLGERLNDLTGRRA